jgi:hypothetical protein
MFACGSAHVYRRRLMLLFIVAAAPARVSPAVVVGRRTGFRVGRGEKVGRRAAPLLPPAAKLLLLLMVGVGRKTLVSSRVGVGRRMVGRDVMTGRAVGCCGLGVGTGAGRDVGGGDEGIASPSVNDEVETGAGVGFLVGLTVGSGVGGRCGCCVGNV